MYIRVPEKSNRVSADMKSPKEIEVEKWSKYYQNLNSFMQPNEYLLKLLLGNYEGKKNFLEGKDGWNSAFSNLKCLDSACGDGRNIPLLNRLGFSVFASEISDKICEKVVNCMISQKDGNLKAELTKEILKKAAIYKKQTEVKNFKPYTNTSTRGDNTNGTKSK